MIKIFTKLEEHITGLRSIDEFRDQPLSFIITTEPTGEIAPYKLDANKQYVSELRLRSIFWANDAQLETARKISHQVLADALYHNLKPVMSRLELAISNGDRRSAYEAMARLRDAITP